MWQNLIESYFGIEARLGEYQWAVGLSYSREIGSPAILMFLGQNDIGRARFKAINPMQ
jgi:hypothetical protein